MACWICGTTGSGDPSVGLYEDDGICPHCEDLGYEENCPKGCYTTPEGELRECPAHDGNQGEAAEQRQLSAFYGGGGVRPIREQYEAACEERRKLRRR